MKSLKWCFDFKYAPVVNASDSFLMEMTNQLPKEFERLTSKNFDRERFQLCFHPEEGIMSGDSSNNFISSVKMWLFFPVGGLDVIVSWFDPISPRDVIPRDEVLPGHVEFHWQNLDVEDPIISQLPMSMLDIRQLFDIHATFPIFSYSNYIATDIDLIFKLRKKDDLHNLELLIANAINEWNGQELIHGIGDYNLFGLIHSFSFLSINKNNAGFSFDLGSAGEKGFKFIFLAIEKSNIEIIEVELINN